MASDSTAAFHHAGPTTTSDLISMGNYAYGGGGMNFAGNGRILFGAHNSLDSSLTHVVNSLPGLKHDTGFAAEWSIDEQYKLEEGLSKYAGEPNIAKYIKIAASIRDKTVRDVALRCRWMTRKRRKQEHPCLGNKVKDPKDKLAEPDLKNNMSSASSVNLSPYSSTTNHQKQSGYTLSALSGSTRHLVEENSQAFEQISVNLSTHKLQQNIALFFHVRNNIIAILDSMTKMPGIMSQMPPLPVILNEELTSSIFPPSSQMMLRSSSVKQEPGY